MDVYPSRSWPRDDYDARAPVLKSYAQEPPYHRDHARAPEATRISRYEERSPDRKHWDRSVERIVEPTRLDRRLFSSAQLFQKKKKVSLIQLIPSFLTGTKCLKPEYTSEGILHAGEFEMILHLEPKAG
jgi:hypothetical protein